MQETRVNHIILFILSGHGDYDMSAYQACLSGQLKDYEVSEEEIKISLGDLLKVNILS